jgi:glycogenin glucosyltransferase
MANAWVTLATTDGYAIGALVLAHSLRNVGTEHKLHVLFTNGVSPPLKEQLKVTFDAWTEVDVLDSHDEENLALIGRPDLGVTFTKLHCWRLIQYSKCVFLDADIIMVKNSDELFERPEFSAAPDIGWPDFFNSGVFVFIPSLETYRNLLKFALTFGSFDGGDQGLLNQYFHTWRESSAEHRLPFLYNVTTGAIYSYAAALKQHATDIKIVHFLGKQKPWQAQHYSGSGIGGTFVVEYLRNWQEIYARHVQPQLPTSLQSIFDSGNFNQHLSSSIGSSDATSINRHEMGGGSAPLSDEEKRYEAWEMGQPDFGDKDSFENIQKAIARSLHQK